MRTTTLIPASVTTAPSLRDLTGAFPLRFHDAALETSFRASYLARSLPQIRISLLLGAVMYAAFGLLDRLIIPAFVEQARILRYGVICPVLLLAFGATCTAAGRRHVIAVEVVAAAVAGVGVIWFATRSAGISALMFGAGVPLVCVYAYTFMRLPVTVAVAAMVPLSIGYLCSLAVHLGGTPVIWVNEAFFTLAFNVAGISACYAMEWHDRHSFIQQRTISERTEALQQALASVKVLSSLLPMCAWCRKVRDDEGYWDQVEGYLQREAGTTVSHGICPECEARVMAREAEGEARAGEG